MIRLTTTKRLNAIEAQIASLTSQVAALESRPATVEIVVGTDRVELRAIIKQQLNELVPVVLEAVKSRMMRSR